MKRARILTAIFLSSLLLCLVDPLEGVPLGSAFTYQGRLVDSNYTAYGLYDFQFRLYDANAAGNQVGNDINKPDVDVIDGYFAVELDFGNSVFDGNERWLEISVRPSGDVNNPNVLSSRQKITPTPYAVYAKSGTPGPQGEQGPVGPQGLVGPKGDKPAHQWSSTYLRFENPDGSWGGYVNLQGPPGAGRQLFTSSGIFTAPAGVTIVYITMCGGGGGGGSGYSGSGGCGGASGYGVIKYPYTVVGGGSYSVIVGAGGSGGISTSWPNPGSQGSSSVFDALTAAGGAGGGGAGGAGGAVSNQEYGLAKPGSNGAGGYGGAGGGSIAGRGGDAGSSTWPGISGYGYGAGGGGGGGINAAGGNGSAGFVLVEW